LGVAWVQEEATPNPQGEKTRPKKFNQRNGNKMQNSFGFQNTASAIFAKLWAMVTQKFKEVITVFMPTSWPPNINFF